MTGAAALSAFAGTEPPPEHLRFDSDRLREWVGSRIPSFDGPVTVEKFKGGQSNPTYRIATNRGAYALRRKPPGPLLPGAHAIDREFRVLSALEGSGVPIPRPHLYCDDESVIGSQFYIVDAVDGVIFWDARMPDVSRDYRAAYYRDLIGCLAKIHTVDWQAAGLTGFGKSEGYSARNLERWSKAFEKTRLVDIPAMDRVASALRERLPQDEPVSLIHGDYGNHNVIAAPDQPRILAVLDWEMSTIGNPLIDLAHSLRPWFRPSETDPSRPVLPADEIATLGIPRMEEAMALYADRTGLTWSDPAFYLAFVLFRTAAMIQGILHRRTIGTASNSRVAYDQDSVVALAQAARTILDDAS